MLSLCNGNAVYKCLDHILHRPQVFSYCTCQWVKAQSCHIGPQILNHVKWTLKYVKSCSDVSYSLQSQLYALKSMSTIGQQLSYGLMSLVSQMLTHIPGLSCTVSWVMSKGPTVLKLCHLVSKFFGCYSYILNNLLEPKCIDSRHWPLKYYTVTFKWCHWSIDSYHKSTGPSTLYN